MKREANRKQEEIRRKLNKHYNNKWKAKLKLLNPEDNSLWQLSKSLKQTVHQVPPLQKENGIAHREQEKAEVFAETMKNQFQLNECTQCTPTTQTR